MWLTKTYICVLVVVMASCHFNKQPSSTHVTVDAFKVIQMVASVPYMAAAYISSPAPAYRCLTASLTSVNETLKEGTYSWYFKSPIDHRAVVRQVNFHVRPGSTSDTLHFTVEGVCILWVTPELVNNIPQQCLSEYHVTCPVEYRAYYSDIC
ncbi:uncharacterized protein LOC119373454 isoform X2 [Rhipicephalus sanguineus]|uniref:uncharacterized protein LOC119373454 isoform X2 n=1 Tax=Rhipicephalus sanguineus TaxID=34632 RepID=UPI001895CD48|nr:uncharacterized protein LOC119373454 isoform X2 [Rhipicephalus sanguineus]